MSIAGCQAEPLSAPLDLVVVDDDSLTLEIVSWICRGTTTRFRLFEDSEAALEHLSDSMPATLIVDYYMPEQNGLEFLQQLDTRCELGTTDIYLCSAITPTQSQRDQLELLGTSILDKSVICDRQALLALIESSAQVISEVTGNE